MLIPATFLKYANRMITTINHTALYRISDRKKANSTRCVADNILPNNVKTANTTAPIEMKSQVLRCRSLEKKVFVNKSCGTKKEKSKNTVQLRSTNFISLSTVYLNFPFSF